MSLKAVTRLTTDFIKFEYDLQAFPVHSQQHFKWYWQAVKVIPTHAVEHHWLIVAVALSYLQSFANSASLAAN